MNRRERRQVWKESKKQFTDKEQWREAWNKDFSQTRLSLNEVVKPQVINIESEDTEEDA